MSEPILIAKNNKISSYILPKMANRHGLIAELPAPEKR